MPFNRLPRFLANPLIGQPGSGQKKRRISVRELLHDEFGEAGTRVFDRLEELAREVTPLTGVGPAIWFTPHGGCLGKKPRVTHESRIKPSDN